METYKLAYEKILHKQSAFSSRDVECEIAWTGSQLVLHPSEDYLNFANSVARAREEAAKKHKRNGRYGCKDDAVTDLVGVLGEMCIAVVTDKRWYAFNGDKFFEESRDKADVGDNIQVRAVAGDRKYLLVHPEDISDYFFVLCRVDEASGVTAAVGWDLGETVKRASPCEDWWDNGRPCHRQHYSRTQPMSDFPYLRAELKVSTNSEIEFWKRMREYWAAALSEHQEEISLAGASLSRRLTLQRFQWLVQYCTDHAAGKFEKEEQYGPGI